MEATDSRQLTQRRTQFQATADGNPVWFAARAGLILLGPFTLAAYSAAPSAEALRQVIASAPHAQAVAAAHVVDLETGQTVFSYQADEPLIPASNMKVFTMAGGVWTLGTDFAFETRIGLAGNTVYVVGDGDPGLGDKKIAQRYDDEVMGVLQRWAAAIKEAGRGGTIQDIVVDGSIFDDQSVHPGWEPEDLGKWYAAPVWGLNFNDNCVDFVVFPAAKAGEPARIEMTPASPLIEIRNKCKTRGKGNPILHHPPGTQEYVISGGCNKRWPLPPVAFPNGPLLLGSALQVELENAGLRVAGTVRQGFVAESVRADDLRWIATHRTSLPDVLDRVGKDSQNLFAECLLKRVGKEWKRRNGEAHQPGSWDAGAQAVNAMLVAAGISRDGFVMADGSGLSRDNRCTARQLTSVLGWMDRRPEREVFVSALSEAGVDGSLRTRLRNTPGTLYGKTGTMRGVRSLSGYIDSHAGKRYALAIIFNDYPGGSAPYKAIQDKVCQLLAADKS